jgi:solute carrier family 36 (proton-coupled amino acid transporter)
MAVFNLELPDSFEVKYWDVSKLVLFMCGFQNMYEGNVNLLNLYGETRSPKNFSCNLIVVMIFITTLSVFMGIAGYLAFGEQTQDLILLNLPVGWGLSITAKLLYVFCICGSFLLLIQPIYSYMDSKEPASNAEEDEDRDGDAWDTQYSVFVLKRVTFVYGVFACGQMITSIETLLQVAGAILGVAINYIIPCAFYNRAYCYEHLNKDKGSMKEL